MSDDNALRALADAEEHLLRHALRHTVATKAWAIDGENLLKHHSAQALAFHPGARTRDDSHLGSLQGAAHFDLRPQPAEPVRWSLLDSRGKSVASVTRNDGRPVAVHAAIGGRYMLTAQRLRDQQTIGAAQLSIPAFLRVDAQLSNNAPTLSALKVPVSHHVLLWAALNSTARAVAQHILRPVNVRLIWDQDTPPAPFLPANAPAEQEAALTPVPALRFDMHSHMRQVHPYQGTVLLVAPGTFVNRTPAALAALLQGVASELGAALLRALYWQFIDLPSSDPALPKKFTDEPAWSLDGALSLGNFALLRCGLGALDFNGASIDATHGDEADRALQALAEVVDWAAPASNAYQRFVEFAGRRMGASIAHAVLRLLGIHAQQDGHLLDKKSQAVVASSVTASEPHDALRDLLGLQQPSGDTPRPFSQLMTDLDDQLARSQGGKQPIRHQWTDLAVLESAPFRTGTLAEPMRAMPGSASKYDVLAGLLDPAALQQLESTLGILPPTYGDATLGPGDRDALPGDTRHSRYGGILTERSDMIELLQRDLAAVGIGIGLQDRGDYAYRRFTTALTCYDGVAADDTSPSNIARMKAGNTGWAVREFQIACQYPNQVAERWGGAEHYADQLHVVGLPQALVDTDAVMSAPNPRVNGELDIVAAHRLRTWRFTRRRYPVVIATGTADGMHAQAIGALPTIENLYRTDGAPSTDYRMFVLDRSGYFDAPLTPASLGDWGNGGWAGPRATANHAQKAVTPGAVSGLPDADWIAPLKQAQETPEQREDRERRERFLDVYRVIGAVAKVEAVGYFDGLNAYDNAVFSYPLFHHTLTLSPGRPAQMAAFVRWLQQPSADLLSSVFPDTSSHQDTGDDKSPAQLRTGLEHCLQQTYTRCFGRFGMGASAVGSNIETGFIAVAGMETATTASGAQVDMRVDWNRQNATSKLRQQALYQAYQQWFRTWHWCYRFAAALRHDQVLRTLLFAYEAHWIDRLLTKNSTLRERILTQQGRALGVRIQVRGLAQFSLADAGRAAHGKTDEATAIRDAIRVARDSHLPDSDAYKSLNGLHTSTGAVANFHQNNLRPWQGGSQSNDIYQRVRDDLLRSLVRA